MPSPQAWQFAESDAAAPFPSAGGSGGTGSGNPAASQEEAKRQLQGPAIGLLIVGILGILSSVTRIVFHLLGISLAGLLSNQMPQNNSMIAQYLTGAVGVVLNIVGMAMSAFVIYGAIQMKNAKGHTLSLITSIIAMIPCFSPCCCIGLPIGIWAVVVLVKPEVKAGFPS